MPVLRVVIAEDDTSIRELLVHHLAREGFRCIEARDGPSTLRAVRAGSDVLVLDVGLPVLDGFDVVRTLRREGRTHPVLILTARADEVDRVIGLELGADDYVTKPFSPREVVARVRALARRGGMPVQSGPAVLRFSRLEVDEAALAAASERAVDMAKAGQSHPAFSSAMKYYGTELNKRRFEILMSAGGIDTLEWESERSKNGARPRAWLRTKANSIEGGTSEVMLGIVAKRILDLPGA